MLVISAVALGACGGGAVPAATPALVTGALSLQFFYARIDAQPVAASVTAPAASTIEQRLAARFDALAVAPSLGPNGSLNVVRDASRLASARVAGDLATLDFKVPTDDWGLWDAREVRAFVQQVVFSATDEHGVRRVRLTENDGANARFAVDDLIVTYAAPLTRETVGVGAATEHDLVYFARDGGRPVAVALDAAGSGATPEERVRARLVALEDGPQNVAPDLFNVVRRMNARLATVRVDGDLATLDYLVPGDDWGVDGSAMLRALVQQLVYTATEEPGIARALVTQNGGRTAIIGGEGLMVDRPQTRRGVGGD